MTTESIESILLYVLGKWGPAWLGLYGAYVLSHNMAILLIYIAAVTINDILNRLLKVWLKEERPNIWTNDKKHFLYYGMPSGHAQHVAFMATFIYLLTHCSAFQLPSSMKIGCKELTKEKANMYLVLAITAITMFERIYSGQHTVKQVVVGAIIGIIFAFGIYYLVTSNSESLSLCEAKAMIY